MANLGTDQVSETHFDCTPNVLLMAYKIEFNSFMKEFLQKRKNKNKYIYPNGDNKYHEHAQNNMSNVTCR